MPKTEPLYCTFDQDDWAGLSLYNSKGETVVVITNITPEAFSLIKAAPKLLEASTLALRELRGFHLDNDSQAIQELAAAIDEANTAVDFVEET